MRIVFVISFVMNLILTTVAVIRCPGEVAIHFGAGGDANGWAPSYVNALLMSGVHILIFVSFFFTPQLMRITPSRWISLPNKEYWCRPENRPRMESVITVQMYAFGIVTFALMFLVGLLALQANLSNPVRFREDLFWWAFGLFMAYTAYWTVKLLLVFRVPKEERR